MLLLDKDQFDLFEYLPKPTIMKNNKIIISHSGNASKFSEKAFVSVSDEENSITKIKRIYHAFNQIKSKQNMNEIDRKLIDYLDESIKHLILNPKIVTNLYFNLSF